MHILPLFKKVGLIIPMPVSTVRPKQPVDEIAKELGRLAEIPVFHNIVVRHLHPKARLSLRT